MQSFLPIFYLTQALSSMSMAVANEAQALFLQVTIVKLCIGSFPDLAAYLLTSLPRKPNMKSGVTTKKKQITLDSKKMQYYRHLQLL